MARECSRRLRRLADSIEEAVARTEGAGLTVLPANEIRMVEDLLDSLSV
jgi:hypothetical protein